MQEELIQKFKDGNKQAGDDFYNANIKLIDYAVKKFGFVSMDKEETYALVNHAFAKAMIEFDITKGTFSTYFMKLARFTILTFYRDHENMIRPARKDFMQNKITIYCDSLDKVIFTSESNDICVKDTLGSDDDHSDIFIYETLKHLSKIDRKIFTLYYLQDFIQNEIGEMLGISQVAVSRSLKKSKTSLEVVLKEVS